jgi:protein gp37
MASRFADQWGFPPGIVDHGRWTGRVVTDHDRMIEGFKSMPGPTSSVKRVFPFDTADLFHRGVPHAFILSALMEMAERPHLTFQVLTKRGERATEYQFPGNVHVYLSVSTQETTDAALELIPDIKAPVVGLSMEPLVAPVGLLTNAITVDPDHVIIGCESGPRRRPCREEWVRLLIKECHEIMVPCFVKQMNIDGRVSHDPAEWAEDLRVRQYPA